MTTAGEHEEAHERRPPTSVWLVPAQPHRAQLRRRMDGLAAQFATPRFDPHITLVSGVVDDDVAAAGLAAVAAEWPSLELTAGPTDHGPERFKAVYVTFDDTRIHDLAGTVAAALRLSFDPTTLAPHLSLLYVEDLPAATRADVAARHDVRGEVWRFDSLLASRSAGRPDDVERWQTVATARLLHGHGRG